MGLDEASVAITCPARERRNREQADEITGREHRASRRFEPLGKPLASCRQLELTRREFEEVAAEHTRYVKKVGEAALPIGRLYGVNGTPTVKPG